MTDIEVIKSQPFVTHTCDGGDHTIPMASLQTGDLVIVHGLRSAPDYNYQCGRVVDTAPADANRLGVAMLHGRQTVLAVRRRNLLLASCDEDRRRLLINIVWERQLEMRVVRNFLLEQLRGEEGLCLEIASHFAPRENAAEIAPK